MSLGQDPLDMLGSPPSSAGKVDDKPVFWETDGWVYTTGKRRKLIFPL